MIDMICTQCHARFTRRIRSCPICGGEVHVILDRWYPQTTPS